MRLMMSIFHEVLFNEKSKIQKKCEEYDSIFVKQ